VYVAHLLPTLPGSRNQRTVYWFFGDARTAWPIRFTLDGPAQGNELRGAVTALVADVVAMHYVKIVGISLAIIFDASFITLIGIAKRFSNDDPLEIEISGQHDHVANRHATRTRQHEHHHVRHFAGLQQTSRLPGFLQFLRRPVRE
jgi:hypothetical protein